jgi:hypothetical protein
MGRRKRPHLGSFQVWSGLRFVRLPEPCCAGPGSDFPGPWLEGRLPATCRGNLKAPGGPPLVFCLFSAPQTLKEPIAGRTCSQVRPGKSQRSVISHWTGAHGLKSRRCRRSLSVLDPVAPAGAAPLDSIEKLFAVDIDRGVLEKIARKWACETLWSLERGAPPVAPLSHRRK